MQIKLNLNNEIISTEADSSESLLTVLRREKLYSVKCGCTKGFCGNCAVLMNDKPVLSCLIPACMVQNIPIITLEYFQKNENYSRIYNIIKKDFNSVGIQMCGYCNAGKIFATYGLMKQKIEPKDKYNIIAAIKNLGSCCTDMETLTNGISKSLRDYMKFSSAYNQNTENVEKEN